MYLVVGIGGVAAVGVIVTGISVTILGLVIRSRRRKKRKKNVRRFLQAIVSDENVRLRHPIGPQSEATDQQDDDKPTNLSPHNLGIPSCSIFGSNRSISEGPEQKPDCSENGRKGYLVRGTEIMKSNDIYAKEPERRVLDAVSYTHLTLPTKA